MEPRINLGDAFWRFDYKKIEQMRDAIYVADLCIANGHGNWSDDPVAVFWQPYPPDGMSPYFGLYRRMSFHGSAPINGGLMICSAASVAEGVWHGLMAEDGEIVFSRWRHDFRTSTDGTATVDGGRDYMKCMATEGCKPVALRVVGPKFVLVNDDASVEVA